MYRKQLFRPLLTNAFNEPVSIYYYTERRHLICIKAFYTLKRLPTASRRAHTARFSRPSTAGRFAYGSNMNIHQMELRCPEAKLLGTSCIEGVFAGVSRQKGRRSCNHNPSEIQPCGRSPRVTSFHLTGMRDSHDYTIKKDRGISSAKRNPEKTLNVPRSFRL